MGELTIRRNRGIPTIRQPEMGRTGKAAASGGARKAAETAPAAAEALEQRTVRSQAAGRLRESRRTLQTGEAVLSKVQESLKRMAELAKESAGGEEPDRAALQAELERLGREIGRMVDSAFSGSTPLFLDQAADSEEGLEALLYAVMGEASAGKGAGLPDWLVRGIARGEMTPEQILSGLGLDRNASAADVQKALAGASLEGNSAARYLATLYLGAAIAGSTDPSAVLEGLRRLLEKVSQGTPADEAVMQLTDGAFSGFADFQSQLAGGEAPGLEDFLVDLLLSEEGGILLPEVSLPPLLVGLEGAGPDLLLGLLDAALPSEAAPQAGSQPAAETAPPVRKEAEAAAAGSAAAADPGAPVEALELGSVQAVGRDLSGVSLDGASGQLTVAGAVDVVLRGTEEGTRDILITGSGTVTLEGVRASAVTVDAPQARLFSAGENTVAELRLHQGAALTLDGTGVLRLSALRTGPSNTLRLAGGAVVMAAREDRASAAEALPAVILEGPASLAAQAVSVRSGSGERLEPFDILWKTFLPGWSSITSLAVDGHQGRLSLHGGDLPDPVRLWLAKGDPGHGHPTHTLVFQGRDEFGHLRTRYAYLRWSRQAGCFEEVSMYPNPFSITGGEAGRDWVYEEESHTLRILSSQVTAVSGGPGKDARQGLFSGRIALADSIGALELSLGGVVCRVPAGRAFQLGRANEVTLILEDGSSNVFESGAGYAGISLGEGTSLLIDRAGGSSGRMPTGALTASGGAGGAGIGRDRGGGGDRTSRIEIRGGVITATGTGGGAGIGAGKQGAMGPVIITGGTVNAVGGAGGGAGIGGALGAPVGDLSIRGGTISAQAAYQAAAIGAGLRGESGDILIAGSARIAKALGGNPGADIGACLFGQCGAVSISPGADLGGAQLRSRPGIPLQTGGERVTLPQFCLSAGALQLGRLCVSTRARAQASRAVIEADCRYVAQIQAAYGALYDRLEKSLAGAQSPSRKDGEPVRDAAAASALLRDVGRSIPLQPPRALSAGGGRGAEGVEQLLR